MRVYAQREICEIFEALRPCYACHALRLPPVFKSICGDCSKLLGISIALCVCICVIHVCVRAAIKLQIDIIESDNSEQLMG